MSPEKTQETCTFEDKPFKLGFINKVGQQLLNHLLVYQPLVNQPFMAPLNTFADQMLMTQPLAN